MWVRLRAWYFYLGSFKNWQLTTPRGLKGWQSFCIPHFLSHFGKTSQIVPSSSKLPYLNLLCHFGGAVLVRSERIIWALVFEREGQSLTLNSREQMKLFPWTHQVFQTQLLGCRHTPHRKWVESCRPPVAGDTFVGITDTSHRSGAA